MADGVEIKVDATRALAKLGRITPAVRDQLRSVIPPIVRDLASKVEQKLGSELKSRKTLTVAQELRENTGRIYGVARLESPSADGLLPTYLEKGTRPHEIVGNPTLAFPWDKLGGQMAFFHRVNHPGTKAYAFMERTFTEQRDEIVAELRDAVKAGAQKEGQRT